eukprot:6198823-Pleurochrysis_carterae.AAC.5
MFETAISAALLVAASKNERHSRCKRTVEYVCHGGQSSACKTASPECTEPCVCAASTSDSEPASRFRADFSISLD